MLSSESSKPQIKFGQERQNSKSKERFESLMKMIESNNAAIDKLSQQEEIRERVSNKEKISDEHVK